MQKIKLAALFCAAALTISTASAETDISARSAVVADGSSGRLFYEKNADEQRLIASTTKLMTAYTALRVTDDLDKTVTVSANAAGTEGSSMYLKAGETISLRDLMWGMLLVSGNDAAVALAEGCCGSVEEFASRMNETAAELGMTNSSFENPSGLDGEEHYSTARDLSILARAILEEPVLMEMVGTQSTQAAGRTLKNHNKLLAQYPYCTGMKTGYTEHAGRTLVSSAEKDGKTLICVTLNAPDDWSDHVKLLEETFETTESTLLCQAGESLGQAKGPRGFYTNWKLTAVSQVECLLREGETPRLAIGLDYEEVSWQTGGEVGTARWYVGDELIGETKLILTN